MAMMMRNAGVILVALWVVCLPAWALPVYRRNSEYDPESMKERYEKWRAKHGRQYKSGTELEMRFGIYVSNVQMIDYINSLNLSFQLTDNIFADLTNEEFRSKYLGLKRTERPNITESIESEDLPTNIDWRKNGAVTPVKDQGNCGSCWAFSAVAAVEGINKIRTGKLVPLSEQELMDCDIGKDNQGCNGGFMEQAFEYIVKNGGISTETNYPYMGRDGSCDKTKTKLHGATIDGYKTVPKNDMKSLKAAVAKQPVSVAIDAGGYAFQLYSTGVFTGYCGRDLNHGVTAVGYGEESGRKYWIVKNSWGNSWGESGYVRIDRESSDERGICGIAMEASYPVKA